MQKQIIVAYNHFNPCEREGDVIGAEGGEGSRGELWGPRYEAGTSLGSALGASDPAAAGPGVCWCGPTPAPAAPAPLTRDAGSAEGVEGLSPPRGAASQEGPTVPGLLMAPFLFGKGGLWATAWLDGSWGRWGPPPRSEAWGAGGVPPPLLALGEAKWAMPIPAETRPSAIGWRGQAASGEAVTGFSLQWQAESDVLCLGNH